MMHMTGMTSDETITRAMGRLQQTAGNPVATTTQRQKVHAAFSPPMPLIPSELYQLSIAIVAIIIDGYGSHGVERAAVFHVLEFFAKFSFAILVDGRAVP